MSKDFGEPFRVVTEEATFVDGEGGETRQTQIIGIDRQDVGDEYWLFAREDDEETRALYERICQTMNAFAGHGDDAVQDGRNSHD